MYIDVTHLKHLLLCTYKMIGNAVPINLAYKIAIAIKPVLTV